MVLINITFTTLFLIFPCRFLVLLSVSVYIPYIPCIMCMCTWLALVSSMYDHLLSLLFSLFSISFSSLLPALSVSLHPSACSSTNCAADNLFTRATITHWHLLGRLDHNDGNVDEEGSILRRTSLAKLHSLTIEAPITKVINIIAAAQQNCPLYIAQALERVLEILRTTELYSPQFFDGNKVRTDDPLTTDLLGALLAVIYFLLTIRLLE